MKEKDAFEKALKHIVDKPDGTRDSKTLADALLYVLKYGRFDIF